ncbi:MAG: 4Fe-4S dicluster domain-containing protein [Bacteroidota bacterium]
MEQIIFTILLLLALAFFSVTLSRIIAFFKLTGPAYAITEIPKRLVMTLQTAFLQDKIFRFPFSGFLHAMVFWGFLTIQFVNLEMVIDGVSGGNKSLAFLGGFYDFMVAAADVFAFIVALFVIIFLVRRAILHVRRLEGKELKPRNHYDAYLALTLIFILMITLMGKNVFYLVGTSGATEGFYPISHLISPLFAGIAADTAYTIHKVNWWAHILLVFLFANILPYSKHFHIFVSIPNVFLSRTTPLGQLPNMENVQKEVKLMMDPETAYSNAPAENAAVPARFGVLDVEDISWKNYIDSLACTQCGRCTAVCPANITGKELSPRKLFVDIRNRMKEKGPGLVKDKTFSDGKTLIRDYIKEEEIWACTTCMACARECPLNIDHPNFIVDMRRYLVMEESKASPELNAMFSNMENNGAPWQYSHEDRLNWIK